DEDGVQRLLSAGELRAAILDGRLKPSTLVWKRGMKNWVPAETIPELMQVIEESRVGRPPAPIPAAGAPAMAGRRMPSISDVATSDEQTDRKAAKPANLIDIASLRAQQLQQHN